MKFRIIDGSENFFTDTDIDPNLIQKNFLLLSRVHMMEVTTY